MKKWYKYFWIIAYGYIFLPFLIFLLGWIKLYIALPAALMLCYGFYRICKEAPVTWMPEWSRENEIKILFIAGVIAIWVYYSGIGKFVFQNADHTVRNGIFNMLVERQWPIVNGEILEGSVFSSNGIKRTGLIYYIGFWLPSALVGKLIGLREGYHAQALWAALGIALVYYLICVIMKKIVVWPLFVMIFFSGLDIVGIFLTGANPLDFGSKLHLEWWGKPYQYSSMTTQLFWVFNQAIPAWLCTMLVYVQKNNRNIVFILACSMLTSTFPFVGLLMLVCFLCFSRKYGENNVDESVGKRIKGYISCFMKDTVTYQNVFGGGIIGITTFLYLKSNSSGNVIMEENINGAEFDNSLAKLVIFLIIEIGVYVVLLYKYNKENKLFYFIVLCLCMIPPVKVGHSADFCMRASIPALFILMILVIRAIDVAWNERDYGVFIGLIATLIIGSITPVCEFERTFSETFRRIKEEETVEADDRDIVEILNSPNFSGDIDNNIFYKYFVK